jgi:hypothetical protein
MKTDVNEASVQSVVLPLWIDLLTHTLGAGSHVRKSKHGYRNHFCASVGSDSDKAFEEMVAAGLAEKGSSLNGGKSVYYRATVEGCKAVGLSKAAIKRAFED